MILKIHNEKKNEFYENMLKNQNFSIKENLEQEKQIEGYTIYEISNHSSFLNFSSFLLEMVNLRELMNN